jgi:hypothetical protein
MLRLPRQLSIALLWLAVVLLPLRAGAVLLMPTLMSTGVAATQTVRAPEVVAAAMPCHVVATAAADEAADTPQTCSYCDLCQANVLQAPWRGAVLPELPAAGPTAAPARAIASNVPDGLFRPPRSLLA